MKLVIVWSGIALVYLALCILSWLTARHLALKEHLSATMVAPVPQRLELVRVPKKSVIAIEYDVERALDLRDDKDREALLEEIVRSLADEDHVSASRLINQLELDEIEMALELTNEIPMQHRDFFLLAVLRRWAEFNGEKAIAYALENLSVATMRAHLPRFASAWAKNHPDLAFQWAVQQRDTAESDPGLVDSTRVGNTRITGAYAPGMIDFAQLNGSILTRWALEDPKAALTQISVLPNEERRIVLARLTNLVGMSETHRDLFMDYIRKLPHSDRDHALEETGANWSSLDFSQFTRWLEGTDLPSDERALLEKGMIRRQQWSHPDSLAEWALGHLQGERLSKQLGTILKSWASYDRPTAMQWIDTKTEGAEMSSALAESIIHSLENTEG